MGKLKAIKLSDFLGWVSDHDSMRESFKEHFGFNIDDVTFSDVIDCDNYEIDIAKDPDWKDVMGDDKLDDDYDIYAFMDAKFGNGVTWFSLEQAGEPNTMLVIDDSNGAISKVGLYDSSVKKNKKK